MNKDHLPPAEGPNQGAPQPEMGSVLPEESKGAITGEGGQETLTGSQASQAQQPAVAQQPLVLPAVDLSDAQAAVQSSDGVVDNSPLIADDVDVIEKEWVDKAKMIIDLTQEDPRTQENEINKLQQSYLEKRYGKKITKTDE